MLNSARQALQFRLSLANKKEVMIKIPGNERQKMSQMGRQKMLEQYDELIVLKYFTQTIADLFNFRNL
jgi:hypothetical protein